MIIEQRIKYYLQAMPIARIDRLGNDWSEPNGFEGVDLKRLNRPQFLNKIKTSFQNTPFKFYMFFTNAHAHTERRYLEVGPVSLSWMQKEMPGAYTDLNVANREFPKEDGITIIFTNNTGDEKMPVSPWILAHRIGHAISASKQGPGGYAFVPNRHIMDDIIDYIMKNYVIACNGNEPTRYIAAGYLNYTLSKICKFASARNGNLVRPSELIHELMAQYLIQGQVTFNRMPDVLHSDDPQMVKIVGELHTIGRKKTLVEITKSVNNDLKSSLENMKGRILVM